MCVCVCVCVTRLIVVLTIDIFMICKNIFSFLIDIYSTRPK